MKDINRFITISNIAIIVLFICSCENTITKNSDSIKYGIVINEINYNSSVDFNPEDWIEIYNPTIETISLGSWEFKDDNDANVFKFPENMVLVSGGYLVLCKDTLAFSSLFPNVLSSDIVGNFEFGLGGGGERIRLFNSDELLINEVEYDDASPWPTEPAGNGPTLELIHPSFDNSSGANWSYSIDNGTPGAENSVYAGER